MGFWLRGVLIAPFFIIMIITIECKLHFSLLPLNPRCSVNMTHTLGSCKREMTSLTNVYIWRTTFARVKKHVFLASDFDQRRFSKILTFFSGIFPFLGAVHTRCNTGFKNS